MSNTKALCFLIVLVIAFLSNTASATNLRDPGLHGANPNAYGQCSSCMNRWFFKDNFGFCNDCCCNEYPQNMYYWCDPSIPCNGGNPYGPYGPGGNPYDPYGPGGNPYHAGGNGRLYNHGGLKY